MAAKPTVLSSVDQQIINALEDLRGTVDSIVLRQTRLEKKINNVQSAVNLLDQDRVVLEKVAVRMKAVEDAIGLNQEHQKNAIKDLKADIKDASDDIGKVTGDVKEVVEEKVGEIIDTVNKRTSILVHETFFGKLLRVVRRVK